MGAVARPVVFLIACTAAVGQLLVDQSGPIYQLSTNATGSELDFATPAPRRGVDEPVQWRIYRLQGGSLQLVASRKAELPVAFPPFTAVYSNYYQLLRPEVSRAGDVLIYTGERTCQGSSSCQNAVTLETTVTGADGRGALIPGAGRLSGNGQYLFQYSAGPFNLGRYTRIVDLQSGAVWHPEALTSGPVTGLGRGRVIADDGTAVFANGSLWVLRQASAEWIPFAGGGFGRVVIDAGANVVAGVWRAFGRPRSLAVYDLNTRMRRTLVSEGDNYDPVLSADGSRILWVSTASGSPQVWIVNTDGSGRRQVTQERAGIEAAVMSDNGQVAWYVSGDGRVVQLDLASGLAQERLSRTAVWNGLAVNAVPGSVLTLQGVGFSEGTTAAQGFPLPTVLGGVRVTIGGVDAPLLYVSPRRIVAQMPWEAPADERLAAKVTTTASSPFESLTAGEIYTYSGFATFVELDGSISAYGGPYALAVHEDWSALVTPDSPARPGEVLHLYATGLGAVEAPPPTGMPAPTDRVVRTLAPVTCSASGADSTPSPVAVPFSGLAPGTVGYYQIDLRVPLSNLRADTQIACLGPGVNGGNFVTAFPVREE